MGANTHGHRLFSSMNYLVQYTVRYKLNNNVYQFWYVSVLFAILIVGKMLFSFFLIRRLLDAQPDPSSPSVVVVSGFWRGGALKPGTEGRVAAAVAVEGEEEEVRRDVIK